MHTVPYTVITDTMKRVLKEEVNRLSESRATAVELDVITETEADDLMSKIYALKDIIDD